jgi:hypothetical protein
MKKTTPQKLSKRLANYGALSLALAGIADANGQIIYTPLNATTNANNDPIEIDLDNDGTFEFDIRLKYTVNLDLNPNSLITGASALGDPTGGSEGNYVYPFALNSGYSIGPISSSTSNNAWSNYNRQSMVFNNCTTSGPSYAQFGCNPGVDKFLGLRFLIDGNTHYGWARLNITDLPNNWTLVDYAYEDTPDTAIMAGEMPPLGVKENVLSNIKIVALNKNIALYNLPQQTNYRLFSITGQSVLDGKISNNTHVIEANTLATGIYIIELKDIKTNAVIRKKIIL